MLFERNSSITMGMVPLEELDSKPRDSFFQEISAFPQRQLAPLATTDCQRCRRQLWAVAAVTRSCPSRRRLEGKGLSKPWVWPHVVVAVKLTVAVHVQVSAQQYQRSRAVVPGPFTCIRRQPFDCHIQCQIHLLEGEL